MKKLKIINIDKYMYDFVDMDGNNYRINIEFHDMEKELQVGDNICFNEQLLNPKYDGYSTSYTFGNFENQYGKKDINLDDIYVIKCIVDEKEIYLKRLYG